MPLAMPWLKSGVLRAPRVHRMDPDDGPRQYGQQPQGSGSAVSIPSWAHAERTVIHNLSHKPSPSDGHGPSAERIT